MELYHNQVTRAQGAFSLRMFHRSWGIMMIQANISALCTALDFPTREAFARELTSQHYDVVGISSIVTNIGKARELCRMARMFWVAMSLPYRPSSRWPTPTTTCAAKGFPGCAGTWAKMRTPRSSTLKSFLDCKPFHGSSSARTPWGNRGHHHSFCRLSHGV
jgi:hypothetical protein